MTKALVLSGGGPVGIAWQTGLVAGLRRKGVDLSVADLVVGTPAGSAVGGPRSLSGVTWRTPWPATRAPSATRGNPPEPALGEPLCPPGAALAL